ncbi:hypothetical protein CVT26_001955 [Gymnopilus dilepis]|uniref:Uncharacterized protein n=1 Tax=Gymnopilus dilepis TaxID=231916 RepID=A0A409X509_9AGAR|nr:hypothetical protein CVT26_001955 [Gymnopilus dilepis]
MPWNAGGYWVAENRTHTPTQYYTLPITHVGYPYPCICLHSTAQEREGSATEEGKGATLNAVARAGKMGVNAAEGADMKEAAFLLRALLGP